MRFFALFKRFRASESGNNTTNAPSTPNDEAGVFWAREAPPDRINEQQFIISKSAKIEEVSLGRIDEQRQKVDLTRSHTAAAPMHSIGILFDIDKLGAEQYGQQALRVIFDWRGLKSTLSLMCGCSLRAGDLDLQLPSAQRPYCFCIHILRHTDVADFSELRKLLSAIDHPSLPAPDARFIVFDNAPMNLVHIANVFSACEVIPTDNGRWALRILLELELLDEIQHNGRISEVVSLLDRGATANAKRYNGRTALHVASFMDRFDIVRLLLEKGADIDAISDNGSTAIQESIHLSMSTTASDIFHLLLDRGADINAGSGALIQAASCDQGEIVQLLLDKGAYINAKDRDGETALFAAANRGNLKVIEALLKKGADVNSKRKGGYTSLMIASDKGFWEVVQTLVNHGADINAKSQKDSTESIGFSTALVSALDNKHFRIAKYLIDTGVDNLNAEQGLIKAAECGQDAIVEILLAKGTDVNAKTKHGYTSLYLASLNGHFFCVQALLRSGADFNAADKEGYTPLILASMNGHIKIVQALIGAGADVNRKETQYGTSALMRAASWGHSGIVQLLLDKGADITARDNLGNSALQMAEKADNAEVVRVLRR